MDYEYRCLICDWIWESDSMFERCPKCDEYDDIFVAESESNE